MDYRRLSYAALMCRGFANVISGSQICLAQPLMGNRWRIQIPEYLMKSSLHTAGLASPCSTHKEENHRDQL